MALNRLIIDGYGQLELNNVSFPRDGRIEAQCDLAATFTKEAPAEVGMLLAVDKANKKVRLPSATEKFSEYFFSTVCFLSLQATRLYV